MNSPSGESMTGARKRFWFRGIALLLGLLPCLVLELALRLTGTAPPEESRDATLGLEGHSPLFVLNAAGDSYEVARERLGYFREASFPARKRASEKRIFVLGGSTVQGRPFAHETAFPRWLETALEVVEPETRWTVVNCGGVSYASYRLVPILDEVLDYEPDVIILCTGHNEFLERRTYDAYFRWPGWRQRLHQWSRSLATVRWVDSWFAGEGAEPSGLGLKPEVDALLDYQDAMQYYERDESWSRAVVHHFGRSLDEMARLARSRDVPIILVHPVSNLRDCPPFKSVPVEDAAPQRAALLGIVEEMQSAELVVQTEGLAEVVRMDPEQALARYWLGKAKDAAEDWGGARAEFEAAIDRDVCPLRATGPIRRELLETAQEFDWLQLDTPGLLGEECRGGILGDEVLVDHVHPTIASHQRIGVALLGPLRELGLVEGTVDRAEIEIRYAAVMSRLPAAYFTHGQERLRTLRLWAQGRAVGAKPPRDEASSNEARVE